MISSHSSPGDGQKLTEQRASVTPGSIPPQRGPGLKEPSGLGTGAPRLALTTFPTSLTSEATQSPLAKLPMMQALCKEQTCPTALPGGSLWPLHQKGKIQTGKHLPSCPQALATNRRASSCACLDAPPIVAAGLTHPAIPGRGREEAGGGVSRTFCAAGHAPGRPGPWDQVGVGVAPARCPQPQWHQTRGAHLVPGVLHDARPVSQDLHEPLGLSLAEHRASNSGDQRLVGQVQSAVGIWGPCAQRGGRASHTGITAKPSTPRSRSWLGSCPQTAQRRSPVEKH